MKKRAVRSKLIPAAAVVILGLFVTCQYPLRWAGRFLIVDQEPQKADVIVVLNGRDTERCLTAVDLFQKGYAKLIVMANGPKQPGCDEFWKRVGKAFNGKTFFQRAVEAMGVPSDCFKLIGSGVTSTYGESLTARDFILENGFKSILLVTSKWHSRRAHLTFTSALKEAGIRVTTCASHYDSFDPERWWRLESDTETVLGEYVRLLYYAATFRISPFD